MARAPGRVRWSGRAASPSTEPGNGCPGPWSERPARAGTGQQSSAGCNKSSRRAATASASPGGTATSMVPRSEATTTMSASMPQKASVRKRTDRRWTWVTSVNGRSMRSLVDANPTDTASSVLQRASPPGTGPSASSAVVHGPHPRADVRRSRHGAATAPPRLSSAARSPAALRRDANGPRRSGRGPFACIDAFFSGPEGPRAAWAAPCARRPRCRGRRLRRSGPPGPC